MATGPKLEGSHVHLTQQGDTSGLEGAGNTTNTTVATSFQAWHDTQDPIQILNTLEKHLMAFKQKKNSPYFGCQRARQAARAPHGGICVPAVSSTAGCTRTHRALSYHILLPAFIPCCSSKHIQPSLLPQRLPQHTRPCSSGKQLTEPCGHSSRDGNTKCSPGQALENLRALQGKTCNY